MLGEEGGLLFAGGGVGKREVVGAPDKFVFFGVGPLLFVGAALVACAFRGLVDSNVSELLI